MVDWCLTIFSVSNRLIDSALKAGGVSQSIDALVEILDQHLQTWSHDELLTGKISSFAALRLSDIVFFDDGRVEVNICAIESISKIQMDTGLQKCPHASEKDKVWGLVLTNASQIIAIFSYFWICHFNSFSQFSLMVLDTRLDSLCNDPSGRLHIMYMFCLT